MVDVLKDKLQLNTLLLASRFLYIYYYVYILSLSMKDSLEVKNISAKIELDHYLEKDKISQSSDFNILH